MPRSRRTRILVLGPAELRRGWADAIRALHRWQVLEPPRAGLVMTLVRESARRSVFPLGEVLVTEAKVRVEGASGLGLVRGWDEAGAEDLAIIDASCRADLAVNLPWWEKLVAAEAQMESDRAVERTILETTRVDFQTMDQEART